MHTGFKSGIKKTDISDHFPIFCCYKYIAEKEDAKKKFHLLNTPVCKDKLKTYLRITLNSPKQFLITLKEISAAPVLLFIFREKKGSFNSFMVRHFSGKVVLAFFKKLSKCIFVVGIFLAGDRAISVNNSLNFLAISASNVINFLSTKSLRGSFYLLR